MAKFDIEKQIIKISEDFFCYMARNYPVMCSSDEFYFFPRAKESVKSLSFLDSLDEQKLKQDISYVRNLKSSLEGLNYEDVDLEAQIDSELLRQSMSTFLREFQELKIWQIDPSLYLKISLFGTDQILTRFSYVKRNFDDSLWQRVSQIPRLLNEAKDNLKEVPLAHLEVAMEMVEASIDYFKTSFFHIENKEKRFAIKGLNTLTKKALKSLEDFKRFLIKRPSRRAFIKDRQFVEGILTDSFSYNRSLEEAFEIALEEYLKTLKQLAHIARKLDPKKTWQQILSAYRIDVKDENVLLELYSTHIERIRDFIIEKDAITIPPTQNIMVAQTPQFMKPLRASASYSSPVTDDSRELAYFYITADFEKGDKSPAKVLGRGKPSKRHLFNNIHNEYIFVTAHETYPGHHLLDSIRRRIANPIRQQVESPLFYEGWASYAERLVDQLGYIKSPLQQLIGLKRQAWRAVRAMFDVGMRIDKLNFKDAEKLLRSLGYASGMAKSMLRHYVLSPGYQLCYTIGKFEIERLRGQFSSKLGLKKFHDFLLQGGQLPFDLIEKRMRSQLCRENF